MKRQTERTKCDFVFGDLSWFSVSLTLFPFVKRQDFPDHFDVRYRLDVVCGPYKVIKYIELCEIGDIRVEYKSVNIETQDKIYIPRRNGSKSISRRSYTSRTIRIRRCRTKSVPKEK